MHYILWHLATSCVETSNLVQWTWVVNSIGYRLCDTKWTIKKGTLVIIAPRITQFQLVTSELREQKKIDYKMNKINIVLTIVCMSLNVTIHCRHFRKENPTPTLKPPNWWAASVSACKTRTVPYTRISFPST